MKGEMEGLFSPENRLRRMLGVEAALARAQSDLGVIPKRAAEEIERKATLKHVKSAEVAKLREEKRHGVVAMVEILSKACGESGSYVHFGATSNDISDTALALQIKDALELLKESLEKLESQLYTDAHITSLERSREHINECEKRIIVGKLSGAVGTHAALGEKGREVEAEVMQILGLKTATASNQLLQRDRHAELALYLAGLAGVLEGIAVEIGCDSALGPARIVRSRANCALENIAVEHEGELTTLPFEVVVIPEIFILTSEMLDAIGEGLKAP